MCFEQEGLGFTESCDQLYLADMGIPDGIFAKLGIKYYSPFHEKFVVALEKCPQPSRTSAATSATAEERKACQECRQNKTGRSDENGAFFCHDCWKDFDDAQSNGH